MKIITIGLPLLLFIAACQQNGKKETDQSKQTLNTSTTEISALEDKQTYQYLKNGDTILLDISITGDKVQGDLSYRWKEKDQNTGHIDGVLKDSLLLADYTFSSEGKTSVRQVAFKLSKDAAVEGYGDSEDKNGKVSFVDPSKLSYDDKFVLESVKP